MQHFIYPENQYKHTNNYGTLIVEHATDEDMIRATIVRSGVSKTIRLTPDQSLSLAAFILSKHPDVAKGETLAFSAETRACDAIPEPDFTVITPTNGLRATTGEPPLDGDGDDQDVKVPESAPADTGDLHPDQERRLTALREVSKLLAGRLSHERLSEWTGWVLNGDTPTN